MHKFGARENPISFNISHSFSHLTQKIYRNFAICDVYMYPIFDKSLLPKTFCDMVDLCMYICINMSLELVIVKQHNKIIVIVILRT